MVARPIHAAITFDLHDVDDPADVRFTATRLRDAGVSATFFIPSSLLAEPRYREVYGELISLGHEPASHSHLHDRDEYSAMARGDRTRLDFLEKSRDLHAEFFGRAPLSFRAPFWGKIAPETARRLAGLGYIADASATPQRLPFLSSSPFRKGWLFAPRAPYELAPGLLEIPTSCLGIPAGASTFPMLRKRASLAYLELLRLEARCFGNRVIVTMHHVEDFNPNSKRGQPDKFGPLDLLPLPTGGFGFRHHIRDNDPKRIAATHEALLAWFANLKCMTLSAIAEEWKAPAGSRETANGSSRIPSRAQ